MSSLDLSERYLAEAVRRSLDVRLMDIRLCPDPVIGSEISFTVPGGEFWQLLSVTFTLTTSAVAGNRSNTLVFDNGTTILGQYGMQDIQGPSVTARYTYAALGFAKTTYSNLSIFGPFPREQYLLPGWRFRTLTASLDAGDDYSAPAIVIRRLDPLMLSQMTDLVESELRGIG